MKKKIIILICIILPLIIGCKKNAYTISGTVLDTAYEGKNVYLKQITDSALVALDSVIIENGIFKLTGKTKSPLLCNISLDPKVGSAIQSETQILIESGALDVSFDTITQVSGTPVNEAYTKMRNGLKQNMIEFRKVRDQYYNETDQLKVDSLEKVLRKMELNSCQMYYEFAKNNMTNELGRFVFIKNYPMFSKEQQKELLDMTDDEFKNSKAIKELADKLYNSF